MNIPSTLRTCLFVLLLHADSDTTTAKYQILEGYSVISVKSCTCMPTFLRPNFLSYIRNLSILRLSFVIKLYTSLFSLC